MLRLRHCERESSALTRTNSPSIDPHPVGARAVERVEVGHQLDGRGGHVAVLPARPRAAGEPLVDGRGGQREAPSGREVAVGRGHRPACRRGRAGTTRFARRGWAPPRVRTLDAGRRDGREDDAGGTLRAGACGPGGGPPPADRTSPWPPGRRRAAAAPATGRPARAPARSGDALVERADAHDPRHGGGVLVEGEERGREQEQRHDGELDVVEVERTSACRWCRPSPAPREREPDQRRARAGPAAPTPTASGRAPPW